MLLIPVGIINERHEPPVYYGVERPFVDTVIMPTTWFEVGAGVLGEVGRGWRYRAYVMSPLNAGSSTPRKGCAKASRKARETNVGRPAVTGRLEYVGLRGLTVGASFWTGDRASSSGRASTCPSRLARPTRGTRAIASSCAASSRGSPSATPTC